MDERLAGTIVTANGIDGQSHDDVQPSGDMVEVSLDQKPTPPQDPQQPKESINLLEAFTDSEVSKLSMRVIEDYDEDVKAREDHMRDLRRWYELYASLMRVKNWPFQGAANVNDPLLTYSILQVHGRLFDMLFPAKGNLYNSLPTRESDPQEVDRAERTELFFNWYLREKVPEYRMSYDATLWQLIIFGSVFRYAYWDYTENRLCTEWISVEDMVVPYARKCPDPNMRGVKRYTLRRYMSIFDIEDRIDSGEYIETARAKVRPGTNVSEPRSEFREVVDKVDGTSEPTPGQFMEDEERLVLEQHRKMRLPKDPQRHPSFDGKAHPVIVTLDHSTKTVLRVVLREEDDPADAKRFAREQAAFQQASQPQVDPQTGQPMPTPATPPTPPKPVRQREVCLFTHYLCFQGEGFYGLGFGSFIGPLNEAQNTLINQQIDRSTVNNAGGGIISRQLRFQRGPIDRQPGQYTEIDAPPAAMKDGLQNWPQVPPDPDGRFHLQHIEQMANRVSGAGDTLSGEPVGSNETARAAMARYEQAQKQISVLAARVIGYLTCDARIIWRLFSVFLDESEYHDVVDSMGKPRSVQIGRADFIADARVQPTADARLTSRAQRVGEAQDFFQFICANPAAPELSQNPAIRRAAIERVLYAMDAHEVIDLLGPPPGPPQPPPPKPQWEENAEFLREHDQQVNPQDDDDQHLLVIQLFRQDPLGAVKLSPTGAKMLDNHERGHYAAKIEKENKNAQQQQQVASPQGGPTPGVAPAPNNGPPTGAPLQ